MNIPKPSPRDLEILGRLESEYAVADRFSSGSVEAKHIRLIAHLHSQAETLTAERGQWKKQCESECQYGYLRQDELDAVKAELAALRSAPGMEEIDVCYQRSRDLGPTECRVEELAYIASRAITSRKEAIVSRDEVVGLLKFAVSSDLLWIIRRQLAGKGNWSEETKQKGRRILEIVEGK